MLAAKARKRVALSWENALYCFIGCFLGTLVGVLPGIGPVATVACCCPSPPDLGPRRP
jgi:putative tricarboxylic transport membrane protein